MADGGGGNGDPRGPLFDEIFDVEEAVVAGGFDVFGELRGGEVRVVEGFGTDGPDGGDPGKASADMPPCESSIRRADGGFDLFAGFERREGGVSDEDGSVGVLEHGDGVGWGGEEGGAGVEELAEEDFGVGEGAAGGGVGRDGFYGAEGVRGFDDELDGADFVE